MVCNHAAVSYESVDADVDHVHLSRQGFDARVMSRSLWEATSLSIPSASQFSYMLPAVTACRHTK